MRIGIYTHNEPEPGCILTSLAQIPFFRPPTHGDWGRRPYRIVDMETGEVLDSYTPPKPQRPKPITPWKGSWVQMMQDRCFAAQSAS